MYTTQHFEDLKAVYEAHKKDCNVFVSHCYGTIHTLRLVSWLREQGRGGEVRGVAMISFGARAPVSLGLVGKLPAFVLGKSPLATIALSDLWSLSLSEWLRPLARASSNRAIFTPNTDPALIRFENSLTESNRMYMMKVQHLSLSLSLPYLFCGDWCCR